MTAPFIFTYPKKVEQKLFSKKDSISIVTIKDILNSKDSLVFVVDRTASMDAYCNSMLLAAQYSNAASKVNGYVFFNDGDDMKDELKKIGSTGGIYVSKSPCLQAALDTMNLCKSKGSGGDFPENVMEALLYASKEFGENIELILIADNGAKIRDMELFSSLRSKVSIYVPVERDFNLDLLTIAHKTGGDFYYRLVTVKNSAIPNVIKSIEEEKLQYSKEVSKEVRKAKRRKK